MRFQHEDKKIPQRFVLIMSPYNIQIENSYKCGLSLFKMFNYGHMFEPKVRTNSADPHLPPLAWFSQILILNYI